METKAIPIWPKEQSPADSICLSLTRNADPKRITDSRLARFVFFILLYKSFQPCVILSLNRLIGWEPVDFAAGSVPEVVKDRYQPGSIALHCDGAVSCSKLLEFLVICRMTRTGRTSDRSNTSLPLELMENTTRTPLSITTNSQS